MVYWVPAIVAFTLFTGSGYATNEDLPADTLACFKTFVSHPPVIQRMVFESISLTRKDPEFYLARWQTNGFFLQCFRTLEDLQSGKESLALRAAGYFENSFWTYKDEGGLSVYVRTARDANGERTNGVYQSCLSQQDFVSSIMNIDRKSVV